MQKQLSQRIIVGIINQSGVYDGMMGPIATSLDTFVEGVFILND